MNRMETLYKTLNIKIVVNHLRSRHDFELVSMEKYPQGGGKVKLNKIPTEENPMQWGIIIYYNQKDAITKIEYKEE